MISFHSIRKTFFSRRRLLNSSVTPPEYYKVNLTIRECCFGFLTFGDTCIPVCQNICINSHCIGNNECKCNSGYYKVDNFRCLPICEPSCGSNMACLAPNKCLCKPDYIKKINESNCEPTCSFTADKFDCINAKCVAPNICECLEGFRKFSDFQCEPVCSNCENGECLSPGVCDCNIGFEKNSQDVCQPICDPSCLNGFCVAPNVCKCNNGFEKYLKSYECLEKQVIEDHQSCLKSCKNGTCVDGECICHPDFEMYSGKCSKKCTKECTNGKCLEDLCVCPDNYKLSDDFTACLPICSFEDGHDCIFGDCISPQVCKCFDGYRFLDDRNCTCVPMCSPGCINGVCTEKGCICHENFYHVSDHECIKNCSEGFTWVYDECIENSSIELFEDTNDSEGIFASTTEMITSYEETSESHETIIVYDEGFPYHYYSTSTER